MNARHPLMRRPGRGVTVAMLNTSAVYQTPTGKLCQLLPRKVEHATDFDTFRFVYIGRGASKGGDPLDRDGFRLTAANVPLLREVIR